MFFNPTQVNSKQEVAEPPLPTYAEVLSDVIAEVETGGSMDCSKKGLSGERGCHQYMPPTWRAYSTEVYGYVAEQTPENAEYVTKEKIQRLLENGYTEQQIFLLWNSGRTSGCSSGVNRYGVAYDSCAYVEEAMAVLAKRS